METRQWWHTPLIPALGKERQTDFCEFKASLVYRASSRTGSKATEKPCLQKQKEKQTNKTPNGTQQELEGSHKVSPSTVEENGLRLLSSVFLPGESGPVCKQCTSLQMCCGCKGSSVAATFFLVQMSVLLLCSRLFLLFFPKR